MSANANAAPQEVNRNPTIAKGHRAAKNSAPPEPVLRKNPFLIVLPAACLLLLGILIFRDFLFGPAVLLFTDIGSDSVNDYYPNFVHLSDYVRTEGLPSWSFFVGMGQDLAYATGYLIWQPVSWLPRELIAPALVYQHLAKLLIAGLLFFCFLQLRGLDWAASMLGALLLAGSAYMCMGSCWYPFADEVVCFAGILFATEQAVQNGRWAFLALLVALAGFITPFHLYLCAVFLLFYVPIRLFGQHGWRPRVILRTCVALAAVAVLGVGLGAVITLPYLAAVLNSPRGSGTTSAVAALSSSSIFRLESPLHYITALLRPLSNDMLGTGDDFRGWQNYLEAPMTYCGLLTLLLVPQIFIRAPRRHLIIFAVFLAGALIPVVFPWFRYLFWLFQGDYYRAESLFFILGLITLSTMVLSRFANGRGLNLWALGATIIGILTILYLSAEQQTEPVLKRDATILLLLYGSLLAAGQLIRRQRIVVWIIFGLAAIELIRFDYVTVSNRKTVTKSDLMERTGYNDETIDAVRDIKANDPSFFRLTKLRASGPSVRWPSLNDALIFGYYGTPSYSSFNNVNYTNFLGAVGAIEPNSETTTRWSLGLLNNSLLSLFAAEKYALVDNPLPFQRALQYEFVRQYDRDFLFRNARWVPLGLTFDRYIPHDVFLTLSKAEIEAVLLRAVVLSNDSDVKTLGLALADISDLKHEMRNSSLEDVVRARRETSLELTSFRQSQIEGKVRGDQKRILVVQTPFDAGWRAWQDGKAAQVLKVNVGLLGVAVDAGEHELQLRYRNPLLGYGLAVTLVSLGILGVCLWRRPRLRLSA